MYVKSTERGERDEELRAIQSQRDKGTCRRLAAVFAYIYFSVFVNGRSSAFGELTTAHDDASQ